jgi:ketosteroid isomerase-like protein
MKRTAWLAVGLGVSIVGLGVVVRGEMPPALRAMVEADRAFAQASVSKGTREAFLEFLADDSLLFRPGPVPGKMFQRNRPSPPGKLVWAPNFADVAASADLGYTVGPYEFRKGEMTETPSSYGHTLSVWRRQRDGQWKVEVNLGVSHDKFTTAVADVKDVQPAPAAAAAPASKPHDTPKAASATHPNEKGVPAKQPSEPPAAAVSPAKQAEEAMKELDRAFAKTVTEQGAVKAFQATASDGIRVYRNDAFPSIGKASVEKLPAQTLGSGWQPAHARVSASGDLAYTTGMVSMGADAVPGSQAQPHYYVRIWRPDKSGAWKLELDMAN